MSDAATMRHYAALFVSIFFNAASLILAKKAMDGDVVPPGALSSIGGWIRIILSPFIIGAILCMAVSFFTWIYSLSAIDLSLAYPSAALSYVLIALASILFFSEHISPLRWTGIAVVTIGISIMYLDGGR